MCKILIQRSTHAHARALPMQMCCGAGPVMGLHTVAPSSVSSNADLGGGHRRTRIGCIKKAFGGSDGIDQRYSAVYLLGGKAPWEISHGAAKFAGIVWAMLLIVQVLDVRRCEPQSGCHARHRRELNKTMFFTRDMLGMDENRRMQYATECSTVPVSSGAGSSWTKDLAG